MKSLIIMSTLSLVLASFSVSAQTSPTITASAKATATLAAVCTISTQNVGFGQISLPVSKQSASSNMTVECTKGSAYTIALAYGGIYGQGSGYNYYVQTGTTTLGGTPYSVYNEYSSNGSLVSSGIKIADSYYSNNGEPANTTYNNSNGEYVSNVGSPAYNYGLLTGASSGDTIGYSIQVPGNSSEVWNAGEYSYTATGTGSNQTIPIVATIQPSNTANQYPTVDTYLDVVTATITY